MNKGFESRNWSIDLLNSPPRLLNMLKQKEKKPPILEAKRETKKRQEIVDLIKPKLESFVESLVIVGSLAFGKNFSIRKSSDIDLLILVEPQSVDGIFECDLFEDDKWTNFAISSFKKNIIQHFTLVSIISEVKVEYHFWNKKYQFKANRLEIEKVMRLTRNYPRGSTFKLDFQGQKYFSDRKVKKYGKGYIQEYPVYRIINNHFIPYEPINNIIMSPDIVFTKDDQLYKNINILWKKLVKRLSQENPGLIDLSKVSIVKSQPGYWALPESVLKKIQKRTEKELSKFSVKYIY